MFTSVFVFAMRTEEEMDNLRYTENNLEYAAGDDHGVGQLRVWNVRSGALLACLEGHSERVVDGAFDGRSQIMTASDDHTCRLWCGRGQAWNLPFPRSRALGAPE